jgi:UDP-N-acetylmuramyl pentapeptide phosphotransferase/UDP-N-acetylglucosamine-1-phosphate transferase
MTASTGSSHLASSATRNSFSSSVCCDPASAAGDAVTARVLILLIVVIAAATALSCLAVVRAIRRAPPPRQGRKRKKSSDLVPQGAGIAVVPVLGTGWLCCVALGVAPAGTIAAILAIAGLAMLSLEDMRVGVAPLYLYTAQAIAVVLGLTFLPGAGHVFHSRLPVTIDLILTTAIWIGAMQALPWHDRREGLSAVSLVMIGTGAAAVAFLGGDRCSGALGLGLVLAAVAVGYLPWAWPPSRVLLGTVGTIPLGFAAAWLLLSLAGTGHEAAALILPGQLIGQLILVTQTRFARESAPSPQSRRHSRTKTASRLPEMTQIILADIALLGLACLSTAWPLPAMAAAALVVLKVTRSLAGLSGLGFRRI